MARAKPRGPVGGVKAKWHKDAPAPKPAEPGASPAPFRCPVAATCPKCGALLGFEDDEKAARAYALRAIKEGTHSPEYCEKKRTGAIPEPVVPEPTKTKKRAARKPARKRR